MTEDEVRGFVPRLSAVCRALAALPFPTIAAVRGTAAGGGCELALACDLRILADDARIGLRETALAIIPGAGGTARLPRIAGMAVAKRWIFTASLFTAEEARQDGVAEAVVPADRLDDEAEALAGRIAANGPVAVRLAKQAIEGGVDLSLDEALAFEWQCYEGVLGTSDREEALKAFAERRPPLFTGR
jgi:enoyl-CoA hydratase/carnithine racemase